MNAHVDVYAYGMISASTLYVLKGVFPRADAYAELGEEYPMTGGEAANSAIVLTKLGVSVKLQGNILGRDNAGNQVAAILGERGIDISAIEQREGVRTVKEMVFSDPETRTNFGTYCALLFETKEWSEPNDGDVESCRVVSLDPFFEDASVKVARLAKKFGKPVVAVDAPYDSEVSALSDILVISGEFRGHKYPDRSLEELFQAYLNHNDGTIIMTAGKGEMLYGAKSSPAQRFPAFRVETRDTAGAGDSFRAGIVYGVLQGWPIEDTLRFSSAVAAIVCTRFPGVLDSPTLTEVQEFLRGYTKG